MAVSVLRKDQKGQKRRLKVPETQMHLQAQPHDASARGEGQPEALQPGNEALAASRSSSAVLAADKLVETEVEAQIEAQIEAKAEAQIDAEIEHELEADLETSLAAEAEAEGSSRGEELASESPVPDPEGSEERAGDAAVRSDSAEGTVEGEEELRKEASVQPQIDEEEVMLVVSIAVSPALAGPLRGVCVDLDVHPGFGKAAKVALGPIASIQRLDSSLQTGMHIAIALTQLPMSHL